MKSPTIIQSGSLGIENGSRTPACQDQQPDHLILLEHNAIKVIEWRRGFRVDNGGLLPAGVGEKVGEMDVARARRSEKMDEWGGGD